MKSTNFLIIKIFVFERYNIILSLWNFKNSFAKEFFGPGGEKVNHLIFDLFWVLEVSRFFRSTYSIDEEPIYRTCLCIRAGEDDFWWSKMKSQVRHQCPVTKSKVVPRVIWRYHRHLPRLVVLNCLRLPVSRCHLWTVWTICQQYVPLQLSLLQGLSSYIKHGEHEELTNFLWLLKFF